MKLEPFRNGRERFTGFNRVCEFEVAHVGVDECVEGLAHRNDMADGSTENPLLRETQVRRAIRTRQDPTPLVWTGADRRR